MIGDGSPFKVFYDSVWAALRDRSTAFGVDLEAWRSEQNNGSSSGTDFEGHTPEPESLRDDDLPALLCFSQTLLPVAPESEQPDELTLQAIRVVQGYVAVGALENPASRERSLLEDKVAAFGWRTWRLLDHFARENFASVVPAGEENPVRFVTIASIDLPNFSVEGVRPAFEITVRAQLVLSRKG